MSVELLKRISSAETDAEKLHADAVREARDQVKAVEEAISIENRQTAAEIRDAAQSVVAQSRAKTEDEIRALKARRSAEREKLCAAASTKVARAGHFVFERIVRNGDR